MKSFLVALAIIWLFLGCFQAISHSLAGLRARRWAIVIVAPVGIVLPNRLYHQLWDWIEYAPRTANVKRSKDEKPAG